MSNKTKIIIDIEYRNELANYKLPLAKFPLAKILRNSPFQNCLCQNALTKVCPAKCPYVIMINNSLTTAKRFSKQNEDDCCYCNRGLFLF